MYYNGTTSKNAKEKIGHFDIGVYEDTKTDKSNITEETHGFENLSINENNEKEKETKNNLNFTFDLSNPIYKQLSEINGKINRMNHSQIRAKLKELRLDSRGNKDVIKKRLKTYYKKKKLDRNNIRDPNSVVYYYDKLIIMDFEATCENKQLKDFKQEIIEFPAVLVNCSTRKITSEFHTYVKPQLNPILSEFCTELTGISQDMVDSAPTFTEVLSKFEDWLTENEMLPHRKNYAIITDGPWDMGRFMLQQCAISDIPFPKWAKKWINIRKTYCHFYNTKMVCLQDMLARMGLDFEGRPHSGIDDSRNIARIVMMLLKDGANLRVNERIHLTKNVFNTSERAVQNVSRREFENMKPNKTDRLQEMPKECYSDDGDDDDI